MAERTIEIITHAISDVTIHIIAHKRLSKPMTHKDALMVISQNGVIKNDLAESLMKFVELANGILHEFQDVDESSIIRSVPMLIVDADTFVQQITASLPYL